VLRVLRDGRLRLVGFDACSTPPPRKALGSARKSLVEYTLGIADPLWKTGVEQMEGREASAAEGALGQAATYVDAVVSR
jgi:hypothetical protein